MQNDSTASTHPTPDLAWQTLAEFSLPSQPGYDCQARTQLAEAVRPLNLPLGQLQRLKTAVAEATLNAIEQGSRYRPDVPVVIRVLVSGQTVLARLAVQGNGSPSPKAETPDLAARLADQQSLRGWGFFLIEKMMDDLRVPGDEAHHTIELFLYLEGGKHDCPPS
jgi:anti-sigma regulatory factor (Ser/Thr protein kinase)